MKIEIFRTYEADVTAGELWIDGVMFCTTVEDVGRPRGIKIYGKTCIPEGEYQVTVNQSPKFKRRMMLLFTNAKTLACEHEGIRFTGVRFHGGVKPEQSEACILIPPVLVETFEEITLAAFDAGKKINVIIGRKV